MKTKIKFLIVVFIALLCTTQAYAQFQNGLFMHHGFSLPYKISFPDNYDKNKAYPLVLFLHGAGEKGSDNEKQLVHGKDFLLNNTKSEYPAIVIAPQCPVDNYWANVKIHNIAGDRTFSFNKNEEPTMPMKTLMSLIEDWLSSGKIDKNRVYVGGLSMGGMGTLELLWRMPNTFAAAFPICGAGSIDKASLYSKNTRIWFFHGDKDNIVEPENTLQIHQYLKSNGYDVKYSIYEGVGHNSWDNAFKEENLFPWLFNHKNKIKKDDKPYQ